MFYIQKGQTVSAEEQVDMKASTASLQESVESEATLAQPQPTTMSTSVVDAETKAAFEEEKLRLYQQLDDKVLLLWIHVYWYIGSETNFIKFLYVNRKLHL